MKQRELDKQAKIPERQNSIKQITNNNLIPKDIKIEIQHCKEAEERVMMQSEDFRGMQIRTEARQKQEKERIMKENEEWKL